MAQPCRNSIPQFSSSRNVPSHGRLRAPLEWSKVKGELEPGQHCAYNKTRECFLGQQVIAGEFSPASLAEWMTKLKPNSGAGVWMNPFRGLLSTEVPFPLDLLYLDENGRVLEAVEFFPTARVSATCPPAASVVALPLHTIFSSQSQPGDQLIICPANEMEWRLNEIAGTESRGGFLRSASAAPALGPVLVRDEPKEPIRPALQREQPRQTIAPTPFHAEPALPAMLQPEPAATVVLPQAPQPAAPPQAQPEPQNQPARKAKPAEQAKPWLDPARQPEKPRGLLGRWLYSEPSDPRNASRQPVTGLVAYFFTGGSPQAHEVRDVSPTGLYVVTKERWYPGTVIRMTLSKPDTGQNPAERSITILTQAVRWGNDGVGVRFVAEGPAKQGGGQAAAYNQVQIGQLDRFLKPLGGGNK
ncbi:MAG: hypothetical protein P4L26_08405 [Terracidiphilus sp.]|nr:hypothetical protein [Terracidiphilus sp.]